MKREKDARQRVIKSPTLWIDLTEHIYTLHSYRPFTVNHLHVH